VTVFLHTQLEVPANNCYQVPKLTMAAYRYKWPKCTMVACHNILAYDGNFHSLSIKPVEIQSLALGLSSLKMYIL
jgi:hypothetical protein